MLIFSVMFLNLCSHVQDFFSSAVTTAYAYLKLSETQNCDEISNVLACRRILKSLKAKNRYLMQEFLLLREHFLVEGKKTQHAMLHGNYIVLKYWKSVHKKSLSFRDKHVR